MAAIAALASFLVTFGRNFLTWAYNVLIDAAQVAFNAMIDFALTVIGVFPSVPLPTGQPSAPVDSTIMSAMLTTLNWLFPMAYMVSVAGFLVASILAYWLVAPVARWLKLLN